MLWFSAPEIYSSWDMQISVYSGFRTSANMSVGVQRHSVSMCSAFISPGRKVRTNTVGSNRSKVIIYQDRYNRRYEQHPSGIQANFRQLFAWKHHLREASLVMCEIWQKLNFYNFAFIFIPAWLPTFDMAPVVCVDLTGFGSARRDSCWVGFMSSYTNDQPVHCIQFCENHRLVHVEPASGVAYLKHVSIMAAVVGSVDTQILA